MNRARTLRRRIVVALVGFAAAVCVIYSGLSLLFVYVVEDAFFESLLTNEAGHIQRQALAGRTVPPQLPFVVLYDTWGSVPAEIRANASPTAREVTGSEGRHYHLQQVALPAHDVWLVAEVSSLLAARRMRLTLLTILLPAALIVLLGGSLVASLVAGRSVRQLNALVARVEGSEVAADGDLQREPADYEVQVLGTALEAALARVQRLLDRERAFVGDVSHELRTPISVIQGAAELLERADLDLTARAQVARIRDAARSGEEIIELLLALEREETAHEAARSVPLLALVERLVIRHRELLGRDDVDVHVEIASKTRVVAPPTALEVVISNLITNALRHGSGAIEIIGQTDTIVVRNIGAPKTVHDPASASEPLLRSRGRGIGLHLVRRLCAVSGFALSFDRSHNGTAAILAFESPAQSHGQVVETLERAKGFEPSTKSLGSSYK